MVPMADAETSKVPQGLQEQDLLGRIIVMVDDDALAQESLAGLLRAWGCFVVASDSLASALDALEEMEVEPEMVISDYRLPGPHTGLDIIARMRERFGATLPALLLSGDTGPETLQEATARQVPLLHKPVRPAKLRAALSHLLGPRQNHHLPEASAGSAMMGAASYGALPCPHRTTLRKTVSTSSVACGATWASACPAWSPPRLM
jgi:CheY-like chemotaxis protein